MKLVYLKNPAPTLELDKKELCSHWIDDNIPAQISNVFGSEVNFDCRELRVRVF